MAPYWKTARLSTACCAVLAFASGARAQASGVEMAASSSCPFEEHAVRPVLEAEVLLVEAMNAKTDSAKRIPLRSAGMVLSAVATPGAQGDKARAWQLGRLLVLWLGLENQPVITSRGALGFAGDSAEQIDLSVWIDSTFSAVESVVPSCVASTTEWRQYPGWVKLVQRAVRQANDGRFDSASVSVSQASRIYARHPYTAFVLGQIAEARGEHKTAIAQFQRAIELSTQDSAYAQARRTAETALGKLALDAARAEQNPDAKHFYLQAATDAYAKMAMEPGGANPSQDGLAAVAAVSGDASVAQAGYQAVLKDPNATFSDAITAGLLAGRAGQIPDAIRLFRRAVDVNPYQRDALNDLATLLATADSATSARPFIDRLLEVDPSNPSNYVLAHDVYSLLERDAVAVSRRYADQAAQLTQPVDAAKSRAFRDSSLAWTASAEAFGRAAAEFLAQKDAIVVGVEFNRWAPRDGSVTLGGTVTNAAAAQKTVTMHVEFLDAAGHTVSTSDVTLTVDPKRSKEFSLTGAGPGIAAFRYRPLT